VHRRTFVVAASDWLGAAALGCRVRPGDAASGPVGPTTRAIGPPRFVGSDPAFVYSRPCFSPGGDLLLFMRAPATDDPVAALNADSSPWGLWTVPVEGGDPAPFFAQPGLAATRPDWCPRTGRIAFTGIRDRQAELWLIDADGKNPTPVPIGSPPRTRLYYPSWYPDGRSVAVTDYAARRVLRVDLASGDATPLTDPAAVWAGMGAASPDSEAGNPLAFAGQLPGGLYHPSRNRIWIQGADRAPRLLDGAPGRTPAWSPRGERLAFGSDRRRPVPTFTLHRRTVSGAAGAIFVQRLGPDTLPLGPPPDAVTPFDHGASHPKWSPDGKRLACMLHSLETGRRGIAVIDLG
jgi:Tol biopolymer transport system component